MKVQQIVTQTIQKVTPDIHSSRRSALIACVSSILNGNSTSVTGIGRGIQGGAFEKHKIKRADRLCSNAFLQFECQSIYQEIISHFGHLSLRPIILVDWSDLDDRQMHFLLRASLAVDGRALTLYEEVHTVKAKDKPSTHKKFLAQLKRMFAKDVKPIIVTDAGFRCPWFQQVCAIGWDFVGRVRNVTQYQLDGGSTWLPIKTLYEQATQTPKLIGHAVLAKANPTPVNLVIYQKLPKGRHCLTRKGTISQWKNSRLTAKREREPWLLATSIKISSTLAKHIVKIYGSRMQIEQNFRDTKNVQYGIGFSANRTKDISRIKILLLLAALSLLILLIIGLVAESKNLEKRFQANTIKTRRVLSLHCLGLRVYKMSSVVFNGCKWLTIISQLKRYVLQCEQETFE